MQRQLNRSIVLLIALFALGSFPYGVQAQDDAVLPPNVIDVWPLAGVEISPTEPLTITFDQPMNQASVEGAFSITPTLAGTFSWSDPRTFAFQPRDNWPRATTFDVVIDTNATSEQGIALADSFATTVETIGALEVATVSPEPDARGIAADRPIVVTFNRPVVALSSTEDQAALPSPLTIEPAIEGTGEWVNTAIYVFRPDRGFAGATTYTATVNAGLESVDGAALETAYSWRFNTLPPQIRSVTPAMGQEAVLLETPVTITFSQPMDRASVESAFSLTASGESIPGTFEWNDDSTVMMFTPHEWLALETTYTINLSTDARSANGEASLESGLSQSFTSAPYPRVLETRPANGATDVQSDFFRASITFNTPMNWETLRGRIEISPEPDSWLPETFSWEPTRFFIIFTPDAETTYTITIKAGVEDTYGNATESDYAFSFTTGPIQEEAYPVINGSFMITGAYRDDTSIAVMTSGRGTFEISLWDIDMADLSVSTPENWEDWRGPFTIETYAFSPNLPPWVADRRPLRTWSQTYDTGKEQKVPQQALLASASGGRLPPGLYWLNVYTGVGTPWMGTTDTFQFALAVSTANVTVKRGPEETLVWVTDLQTGEPVARVPVTIYKDGEIIASGVTDSDGTLVAPVVLPAEVSNVYVEASSDDVYGAWFGNYGVNLPTQRAYLYTDRPIYRPGETVYYRGILRDRHDMDYDVPARDSVHITIKQRFQDMVYWEGDLPLTEFGTFSGEFVIPQDVALGEISIVADFGDRTYYQYDFFGTLWQEEGPSSAVIFTIAEFRPPEYEISVTAQTADAFQGDPLTFLAEAQYYFGGGVSNASVDYNVFYQRTSFDYQGSGAYRFSDETYRNENIGGQLATGDAMTDDAGRALITVSETAMQYPVPIAVQADVTVADESGQGISGRTELVLHPSEVYVGLHADAYFTQPGEETPVSIITVTPESVPVPGQPVEIEVYKVEWVREPIAGQFGRYRWTEEVDLVATEQVTTDASGQAVYTFIAPGEGSYRVRALTRDSRERVNSSSIRMWVSGEDAGFLANPSSNIALEADRDSYRPGDTAQILIPLPFQDTTYVLVTTERAGVMTHEVVAANGSSFVYDLPIREEFVPTVYVAVTAIHGIDSENPYPDFSTGVIRLNVEPVNQRLTIDVEPSAVRHAPGDTVRFDITATDAEGNPVQAEIGVALTDESVLDLLPPNSPTLEENFYGEQPNYVMTFVGLNGLIDALTDAVFPGGRGGGGGGDGPSIYIREDFEFTPLWAPHVVTDENGKATVTAELPDNLTTWIFDARAITTETHFGQQTTEIISTLPLIVRPVAPRFMVVGDRVELAAVINNNTDSEQTVEATLDALGVALEDPETQTVTVPAAGRARVAWTAVVQDVPGVDLTFIALGEDGAQDAAKPLLRTGPDDTIPVYAYTAPDTTGTGGLLREGGASTEAISLPARYADVDGTLAISLDPSVAAATVDTLSYLRQLPYSCIEQTVSRFLPNVVTYAALRDLGIDDPQLQAELRTALDEALTVLASSQHADGSWGWCPETEAGDPLVTAYAALGLIEAREAGFRVSQRMLDQALNFMASRFVRPSINTPAYQLNRHAFYLYVLARADQLSRREFDTLAEHRLNMSLAARAYLLMAAAEAFPTDEARQAPLVSDLTGAALLSSTGAHWEESVADWHNWGSDTRTTALALTALIKADPDNALLPNAVRWLMAARRGDHWATTQETAWSVMALAEWMVATGELNPDYEFTARLNQEEIAAGTVRSENVRETTDLHIEVADLLRDQVNRLTIARTDGPGALYYNAFLNLRLPAGEVNALSRGITVNREYYLNGDRSQPVTRAKVGDTITVRLSLTLPEDIYYFVLEDPLPAGTESLDTSLLTTSLAAETPRLAMRLEDDPYWFWGWWWFDRTELRDEQTTLYADFLPRGSYVYTYQVRATVPGEFQTMPAEAYAFYQPDVFGRTEGGLFEILPGDSPIGDDVEATP